MWQEAPTRFERGQMAVELAVVTPVILLVLVIAIDMLVFAGECARFDHIAARSSSPKAHRPQPENTTMNRACTPSRGPSKSSLRGADRKWPSPARTPGHCLRAWLPIAASLALSRGPFRLLAHRA